MWSAAAGGSRRAASALRVFQLTFWASGAVVPRKNTRSTAPMGTPPMVMASPYDPLADVCVDYHHDLLTPERGPRKRPPACLQGRIARA